VSRCREDSVNGEEGGGHGARHGWSGQMRFSDDHHAQLKSMSIAKWTLGLSSYFTLSPFQIHEQIRVEKPRCQFDKLMNSNPQIKGNESSRCPISRICPNVDGVVQLSSV
jgi:hypothetical protein